MQLYFDMRIIQIHFDIAFTTRHFQLFFYIMNLTLLTVNTGSSSGKKRLFERVLMDKTLVTHLFVHNPFSTIRYTIIHNYLVITNSLD